MSEAVRETPKKERPEFRNIHVTELSNYRMPLASIVSILHRISGFMMFALLPFVLYLLEQSLRSEISFAYYQGIVSYPLVKLIILALVWGYMHHFCAGVRHLVMDAHIGLDKDSARKSSVGVLVVSLTLTAIVALKLFGVF
ncbi:succinate dehydrogenase, cytochrome b556 subunit [Duganella violaceipulchra]|uniref:Succinate dehydrogenase cytochrome b556 subunit n=1 Tax=Duganella violaceipulchra TaxID=2849652 RepID=A0AA41HD81_9BURK|nr:succinate dehydrogenase, cytochrome b556 subunit [Duganella violaceicalia]MBV6324436.1 succinate dehydrogenase, cytochrome b556 subunit [Duganella violaceicalia]MCP2012040.1 succinate dehydrogenase / fumarate reductase cytochrome b subunit [Duganella violaceicalia]